MVGMKAIALAAVLLAPAYVVAASAPLIEDKYEGEEYYNVRPLRINRNRITLIKITGIGEGESGSVAMYGIRCKDFKPTVYQIKRYLQHAKPVSKGYWGHETTWSPCSASGEVVFRDGTKGTWNVMAGGAGILAIKGVRHYLNCEDCAITRILVVK
jgi:hypothetical protein